jgi:putative SOS response-associated peptidase YedK
MCARYSFFSVKLFQPEFDLDPDGIEEHYNIAPTDVVPGIIETAQGRELQFFQWGLVPSWSKDPTVGQKLINARAETLCEKPSFRTAFKRRRCLLPADGFFEWKGEKGNKQPYFIRMRSHKPFALAGLYEYWEGAEGALVTCTIVTTEPNELLSTVHNRMPVIVAKDDYGTWLDPKVQTPEPLMPILAPYPSNELEMYPVTRRMSNPGYESPEIIEQVPSETLF